ncbi:uroporphyrinogen-III C-methyltransferase [Acidihalobacter ferrooxydans]|uniref:Heme biosynthesis operon protein HemX n=1 Tax=Acidihalobacter ferrooxydans TaxID=1765967 RepID=A0A1P8UD29_9GAMM|nr:uroporphyrinogen-III C-methyltransferase [Acidihalobacter ferrooxydans]APZ41694.1 hypothetical protein BW247_00070 [Acidihalobacter ferrooxydans]
MSETEDSRPARPDTPPRRIETPARKDAPQGPADATQKPRRSGATLAAIFLSLIAILITLGGLGAGYWAWRQLHAQQLAQTQDASTLQTQIAAAQAQLRNRVSQQAVATLRSEVSALQQQVQTQTRTIDTLNKAIERIRTLAQRDPRGWRVAEVEYLMRIARYRLDLMGDYAGSIAALQAANRQLAVLADPNLLPVRQALAHEIVTLQDFKQPDRVGIMLELAQLANHLDGLAPPRPTLGGTPVSSAHSPAQGGWRGLLETVWSAISSHIVVRHYNQPIQGMPDAEALLYMNQVLRLRLEAARLAVMRGNNTEYHDELKAALSWLKDHYAPHTATRLKQQLQALLKHDIAPTPPDIGRSLTLLQKLTRGTAAAGSGA